MVRQEEAVGHLHLVRVGPVGRFHLFDESQVGRIRCIENAGTHPGHAEVGDVESIAVPHDLHAVAVPTEVGVTDLAEA